MWFRPVRTGTGPHLTMWRTQRVGAFPIRRWRRPECGWQPDLAVVAEPPALGARRFAAASKRTRQAISAK